jgi:hypothetical protein
MINHEFGSVDEFIAEYVTNISRSGVFIKSKDPLPVGTKVNLKFTVIMDELETIEGIGQVVRVDREPAGMGVVFLTLTSHSQNLIAKLITKRSISDRRRQRESPAALPLVGKVRAVDPPFAPGRKAPAPSKKGRA